MLRRILVLTVGILALLAVGGATLVEAQNVNNGKTSAAGTTVTESPTCPMNFSDVAPGDTFYPFIHCIYCQGVISGFPDGTFRPNANVTRGQLSKIIVNSGHLTGNPGSQLYADVQPGSTFYTDINLLKEQGIIDGYPCGPYYYPYFRPDNPATRAQISKIVTKVIGWYDDPGNQKFTDVLPSNTFYAYIQRLSLHNAISGYVCGGVGEPCDNLNRPYFRPNNQTTRGQLSKIDVYAFFPSCLSLNE
jgi:S-layer homology domain